MENENVIVPSFLGKTMEEAVRSAKEAGLHVSRSKNSGYSSDYPEGQIYQQSVSSGTSLQMGKVVYVRVSKGDAPDPVASPASENTTP
jgi:beta-lactam-binding protein with PASTA domain